MGDDAWIRARHVLAIRLDSLGDLVMTTPALRALRASNATRRVTLLASPAGAKAASMIADVDDCLVYAAPWVKSSAMRPTADADRALIARLRQMQLDAAVIFTVFSQNPLPAAIICQLAEIPLRVAYCRENPYQLLSDWLPERDQLPHVRHEVQRQLDLVAAIGCGATDTRMSLRLTGEDLQQPAARLVARGIDLERPWIVVHPGSTAPSRRYPAELYACVVQRLVDRHRLQVVLTGSEEECHFVEEIQEASRVASVSLAGELSAGQLAGLLAQTRLLVANNSGPVHIAAAVGAPVVDLYALTNPQHTPWGVPHRVLSHDVPCRNCFKSVCPLGHHACLRGVTPDTVVGAVLDLMMETQGYRHVHPGN